jgi:hypothetical protein
MLRVWIHIGYPQKLDGEYQNIPKYVDPIYMVYFGIFWQNGTDDEYKNIFGSLMTFFKLNTLQCYWDSENG